MIKHLSENPPGLAIPVENRLRLEIKTGRPVHYTPPAMGPVKEHSLLDLFDWSRDHYRGPYNHDMLYSAMASARHDAVRLAVEEIHANFEGQDPHSGFIPNMRDEALSRWYDLEPYTFMNPRLRSDYTQPPLEAKAVAETFDAHRRIGKEDEGRSFLEDIYPKLKKSYEYFINTRQNSSDDPMVGIIHPHETGRDSDPTFDFIKWRLPRSGPDTPPVLDIINSVPDYIGALTLNAKNRLKGWDVDKIREHFWVNDIMFNCMYADNLRILANIADYLNKTEDAEQFKNLSAQVFDRISTQMWDPQARDGDGAFYALNKDGSKIREISISNLFPLLNPTLPEHQVVSLATLIKKSFNTPYQLPTVATDSPNYDPNYQGKGIMWRGPVWIWMNDGIAEGLQRQSKRADLPLDLRAQCAIIAAKIRRDSKYLCQDGYETHNPITGEGQRIPHFSANALGHLAVRESILIDA